MMDMNDGSESEVISTLSSSGRDERRISRDGAENHRIHLMNKDEKWDAIHDKRSEELRAKLALDFEYMAEKEEVGFRSSKLAADVRNTDSSEINGFRRAQRMYNEKMTYSNEDSSNFLPKSSHDNDNLMRNGSDYMDDLNTFDYSGRGRAVQLNELDELKDQFTRLDNRNSKGKEKVHFGGGVAHAEPYVSKHSTVDSSLGISRGALQHSHTDSQIRRPSYQTQYDGPPPLMRRQEMGSNGYFPSQYPASHDRVMGIR